jgi:sulfur transfer protein SufE/stress-induced morphogen
MARPSLLLAATVLLLSLSWSSSFLPPSLPPPAPCRELTFLRATSSSAVPADTTGSGPVDAESDAPAAAAAATGKLPPALSNLVQVFSTLPNSKIRHKQLLYLSSLLPPFPTAQCTTANKVKGCLSTVHVTAKANKDDGSIAFEGTSDGVLTKGLLSFLIQGLQNQPIDVIEGVPVAFIAESGIDMSLTVGRNNGFVNMLDFMKVQGRRAYEQWRAKGAHAKEDGSFEEADDAAASTQPIYDEIMTKLAILKPSSVTLTDNSQSHANHPGNPGASSESHFSLSITAECFDGLANVKRHQLIYTILGNTMDKIHALGIECKTP